MRKVFLVIGSVTLEFDEVLFAFSTEELAQKKVNELKNKRNVRFDNYEIKEIEITN